MPFQSSTRSSSFFTQHLIIMMTSESPPPSSNSLGATSAVPSKRLSEAPGPSHSTSAPSHPRRPDRRPDRRRDRRLRPRGPGRRGWSPRAPERHGSWKMSRCDEVGGWMGVVAKRGRTVGVCSGCLVFLGAGTPVSAGWSGVMGLFNLTWTREPAGYKRMCPCLQVWICLDNVPYRASSNFGVASSCCSPSC